MRSILDNRSNIGYMSPKDFVGESYEVLGEGNVAVCIPTYERPNIIYELLQMNAFEYKERNYDIYIYDSSEDNYTEKIVDEWQKKYNNIFYVKMPSKLHSNMKVYKIFQKYGLKKNYKYVWVCSDSIRWSELILNEIDDAIQYSYDIISPCYRDKQCLGIKTYDDKLRFFEDVAWHLTLYGACLLRTDSMLEGVEWDYLENKYNVPDMVNHSHVAFYFEQLLKLTDFSAIFLGHGSEVLCASTLKAVPNWRKDTFYVWAHCFPMMLNSLPDFYNRAKDTVLLKHGTYEMFTIPMLVAYRQENILNYSVYWELKGKWNKLTNVSEKIIERIIASGEIASDFNIEKRREEIKNQEKWLEEVEEMLQFVKDHKNIFIYGAGRCAKRYTEYLCENGLDITGYVVSNLDNNPSFYEGYRVKVCQDIVKCDNVAIIIGVTVETISEVKEHLIKIGFSGDIFDSYIYPLREIRR